MDIQELINKFTNKSLSINPELQGEFDELSFKFQIIIKLVNYRTYNNLTQKQFGERVGIARQSIARFERDGSDPVLSYVEKIISEITKQDISDSDRVDIIALLVSYGHKASEIDEIINILYFNRGNPFDYVKDAEELIIFKSFEDSFFISNLMKNVINNNIDLVKESLTYTNANRVFHEAIPFIALSDSDDMIELFISKGVDVNQSIKTVGGSTFPLLTIYLLDKGDKELTYKKLKLFIMNGAKVNAQTSTGSTLLHSICKEYQKQDFELVKLLVENEIDINIADNNGNTALHNLSKGYFVKEDNEKVVDYLVKAGGDVSIKNKAGDSPADNARKLNEFIKTL